MPLGIPHSEFLSWDPLDQDKALAYTRDQRSRCQMCGTAEREWEDDPYAYDPVVNICPGCERLDHMRGDDAAKMAGARVILTPKRPKQE